MPELANKNAVKYAELTDEHIKDIKRDVELFIKSEEYWDRFAHHSTVARGHKTFSSRRVIAPKVSKDEIQPRAEFIAPRPTKIAVATFEKTVQNYGDKAIYSREDLQYHFDDTVNIVSATLKEVAVQKLDIIKGKAFISSKAIITYDTSLLNTLENAAIIFRKNKVKRWDGVHYLAHLTPEMLKKLRAEIAAKHGEISEPTKKQLDDVATAIGSYGDFMFSVTTSDLLYKDDSTQILVLMGKRGIDGESPVDVAKLEGESNIELINNGLGSGILEDVDGNLTTDDNKQQGSIGINMDGLGAAVSDDLCILNCEVAVAAINGPALDLAERTGFVSTSPASAAAFSAVKAADGTAIASPTIVVKKKSASGASVTAVDGAYPVTPGDTYYYSVSKTGFVTLTGTFVAKPGNTSFVLAMTASE